MEAMVRGISPKARGKLTAGFHIWEDVRGSKGASLLKEGLRPLCLETDRPGGKVLCTAEFTSPITAHQSHQRCLPWGAPEPPHALRDVYHLKASAHSFIPSLICSSIY